MRVIEPSFEIKQFPANVLEMLEECGRVCYKSEDSITSESAKKFIRARLDTGHESVIEHCGATVKFICDRGVSHEIVRHRIASYSQESTRYCNYSKERFGNHVTFIKPYFFPDISSGVYNAVDDFQKEHLGLARAAQIWIENCFYTEDSYNEMINEGCQPQEARSVLPNSLKTEIICTFNMREWRHFFKLRTSPQAHPQMRELTIPLLAEFKKRVPVLFDDINVKGENHE